MDSHDGEKEHAIAIEELRPVNRTDFIFSGHQSVIPSGKLSWIDHQGVADEILTSSFMYVSAQEYSRISFFHHLPQSCASCMVDPECPVHSSVVWGNVSDKNAVFLDRGQRVIDFLFCEFNWRLSLEAIGSPQSTERFVILCHCFPVEVTSFFLQNVYHIIIITVPVYCQIGCGDSTQNCTCLTCMSEMGDVATDYQEITGNTLQARDIRGDPVEVSNDAEVHDTE